MTIDELKFMVDETINTNVNREITGKTLNMALNSIIDALGDNIDKVSSDIEKVVEEVSKAAAPIKFYVDTTAGTLTSEEMAHNAEMVNKVMELLAEEKPIQAVAIPRGTIVDVLEEDFGNAAVQETVGSVHAYAGQGVILSC